MPGPVPRRCARQSSAPALARSAGFTLVELVMVMLLLAVLSYTAGARLLDRGETAARDYAETLAAGLRNAQRSAVAQRRPVHVQLDTSARRVRFCLDDAVTCAQPLRDSFGDDLALQAPAGVALTSAVNAFSFDALGRPSLATALDIGAASATLAATVSVEAETGYVRRR